MIETRKMIADLKRGTLQGITALQMLAEEGVRFICASGTGGSGKDLQLDLMEATLVHNNRIVVHVGTSAAIRHHKEGDDFLGHSLMAASDNEKKGILFPDEPTLAALACDVLGYYPNGFRKVLFSGFPRGTGQPKLALTLKGAIIQHYNIGLRTAIGRAMARTAQREKSNLKPREDDRPSTVRDRFHDHINNTIPELRKLDGLHPYRIKWIDGDQPIAAVLHDSLEAMGCEARLVDDCLSTFERREGGVAKIMEKIEGLETVPTGRSAKRTIQSPKIRQSELTPTAIKIPTHFLGAGTREIFLRGAQPRPSACA